MAKRDDERPMSLNALVLTLWEQGRLTPEQVLLYLLHRLAIEQLIQAALTASPDGTRSADDPPSDDA